MGQFQTVFITVFSGLFLFILSQFFLKFILEPMVEVRKVIGKISSHLVFYSNRFSNIVETERLYENNELRKDILEISNKTRSLASDLQGSVQVVPMYSFFSFFRLLPNIDGINEASSCLIGLSNSLSANADSKSEHIGFNRKLIHDIKVNLHIK